MDKGLLRETESVQNQLAALVKCDVRVVPCLSSLWISLMLCIQILDNEPENEITIAIFRLLVLDLLALFQAVNQGLITVLGLSHRRSMLAGRSFTYWHRSLF